MGVADAIFGAVKQGANYIIDRVGDAIITAISNFIGMLMYYFTCALMWLVGILQELFNVFSGTDKVRYNGRATYLVDVFFQNKSVQNVYWGVALIGIVFVFVFTIFAVIRKTFDIDDKQQKSMGGILRGTFKSVLIMLILSFALSAALNLSNVVINRISYIFDNADSLTQEREIHFTDDQYATMARIYKTIGEYSLNPSYNSQYNLNSCYNAIRPDLHYLVQQGVFNFVYITKDSSGKEVDTWQSVLQELVYASDSSRELKMDVTYGEVNESLLKIMKILRSNANFRPLSDYESGYTVADTVGLDRVLFLTGTGSAAKNSRYNENPYLTDGLRGAFFSGEKSIYSFSDVKGAFDIGITGISYIFIWVLAYFTLRNLLRCIFACVARLFTMVSLYIIAPLTVSTMPMDDGGKFKQWMITMTVQGLGVLGVIIPMRLVILFAPIILSSDLQLFDSVTLNFIAKALLVVGGLEAVEGFSGLVNGILADSASMQAVHNGGLSSSIGMADRVFNKGTRVAARAGVGAAKVASDVSGLTAVGRGLAAAGGAVAGAAGAAYGAFRDNGGLLGAGLMGAGMAAASPFAAAKKLGSAVMNYQSDKKAFSRNGGSDMSANSGSKGSDTSVSGSSGSAAPTSAANPSGGSDKSTGGGKNYSADVQKIFGVDAQGNVAKPKKKAPPLENKHQ